MQEHAGCLIFIDLDNLKKVNDIYGHKAGDRILTLLGETITECAKEAVACRLGGDEFLIFMPDLQKGILNKKMRKQRMEKVLCFLFEIGNQIIIETKGDIE